MNKVVDAFIENGRIAFFKRVEETKTISETTGNVTINNIGRPAIPAHYEVAFTITADLQDGGIELRNVFQLSCIVLNENDGAQYRKVEDQSARQLAPILRAVADHIEKKVADFDSQRGKAKDE